MQAEIALRIHHCRNRPSKRRNNSTLRALTYTKLFSYILECAIAVVVVEFAVGSLQAARAAHNRDAFPDAIVAAARHRCFVEVQIHVLRHEKIHSSVAVVVHERTPRLPPRILVSQPSLFGDVGERAVPIVA